MSIGIESIFHLLYHSHPVFVQPSIVPSASFILIPILETIYLYWPDLAILILTLLDTGLRLSELAGLTLDDCKLAMRYFKVLRKGNRERLVPFG